MAAEWLFPTDTGQEEIVDKNSHQELFVFGYACKLFRDDDQAKLIDAGKYMIPWMGDDKLRIDRYDGRGHLYDLSPYDADNLKGKPAPVLSDEEKQVEKLCDEERFLELHTDMAEKTMYEDKFIRANWKKSGTPVKREEEEWKRYYESLSEGYKAVGFSYDAYGQQYYTEEIIEEAKSDPEEQPFVPPEELQVPPNCKIPETIKENSIIEKTAKFIAEHGAQMEIMMKTKQANNAQFLFMHFENALHPYYKHMVKMIKTRKYKPKFPVNNEDLNESGEDGHHGYLHPDLMATNRASPTPEVYKPVPMPKVSIHETSYGQLLQSFSKVNKEVEEKKKAKELKREIKSEPHDMSSHPACMGQGDYGPANSNMPPPPGIEPVTLPKSSKEKSSLLTVKQEPGSDNEEETETSAPRTTSPPVQIVPPPPDAQPVVDRMAMYVAKNGEEFEIVVKSKKDPRFQFLEPWHMHFSYYSFKKHLFIEEMDREKKEVEQEEKRREKEKAEKLAKGVKFKLKKNKEQESTTLEKKKVFEYDESSDEERNGDTDGVKERRSKSDMSGTSTPVTDIDIVHDSRTEELLVKKLAEQKVKDRLAASAREKLSQADKEKQIKLERKKKASMFLSMLKSKNTGEDDNDSKKESSKPTASNSGRNSPVRTEEPKSSSRRKSKHKSRDRSRSRDKRSRSRSSSKSKKKKRKRSPTPPSAYAVVRRSPIRRPPPPPPPRYIDVRNRYSRSPSGSRNSRHKSRSPSRTKSKKKKRSRSPKSKRDESGHKKSSKKKKKRSKSRSPSKESSHLSVKSTIQEESTAIQEQDPKVVTPVDGRVFSPATLHDPSVLDVVDELEDGETRDSSPEPGQIRDDNEIELENTNLKRPTPPPDIPSEHNMHSRSGSPYSAEQRGNSPQSGSSRSTTPSSRSHLASLSPCKRPLSRSRSRSRTPSSIRSRGTTPTKSFGVSRDGTPSRGINGDTSAASTGETGASLPQKNVSSYMLNRVRAMIQASKDAVRKEEDMFEDS